MRLAGEGLAGIDAPHILTNPDAPGRILPVPSKGAVAVSDAGSATEDRVVRRWDVARYRRGPVAYRMTAA